MTNETEGNASAFSATIDDLKQALFDAEDALNALRDKVAAEVILHQEKGGGVDEVEPEGTLGRLSIERLVGWSDVMSFEKAGKGWGLRYYRWANDNDPTDRVQKTPIVDAPLRIRILAAQKLPELLDAIRQRRAQQLEEIEQAAEAARAFAVRVYEEEATRG